VANTTTSSPTIRAWCSPCTSEVISGIGFTNNLLRAQLGTTNYTLTSVWASRPNWMFHHMALGETIGFSTRVTQNNSGLYDGNVS